MRWRRMFWVKYHIDHLRNWRKAVEAVARAVKDINREAKVYVIGGAAEGRLTIESDVDVVVCIPVGTNDRKLRKEIMRRAIDVYGMPWDYPIELHLYEERECKEILKQLKYIEVS
jgi:predicted nucleotidyltransferase